MCFFLHLFCCCLFCLYFPKLTCCFRSPSQIGETIKQVTSQLMEANTTSDIITLDTRTPPKIKQHAKKKLPKPEPLENSHAGVAIPVDEAEINLEETTKKLSFYKLEKPTTNSGLSTWILLSGQTTPKPSRKPIIKPNENQNTTVLVDSNKIIKPLFKKRITTTTSTTVAPSTTKLTKVKASVLSSAKTTTSTTTSSSTTTTVAPTTSVSSTSTTTNSSSLPLEAKDGESEITEKKTRRPSTSKRKKNKNRRRRPSEKTDTTKIDKLLQSAEKPIGTQLYNYLSREVMPTVGVGLVGLMAAAGLASYFLYPFGVARRSYEIDRRDKNNNFYYSDEYSGGIAEEEAIGKVIAGMPSNSLYSNFKTPTSRHSFSNHMVVEQSTGYMVGGDEATPAAVPEHGPRKRREVNEGENEIDGAITTDDGTSSTTTEGSSTTYRPDKVKSLVDMFKELFHLKVNLGLQLIQNATQAVSKYVSHVQRRLDEHYRNYTLTN